MHTYKAKMWYTDTENLKKRTATVFNYKSGSQVCPCVQKKKAYLKTGTNESKGTFTTLQSKAIICEISNSQQKRFTPGRRGE